MAPRTRSLALLASTVALALAPKCPLCLLAYLGLAGAVGLSAGVVGWYQEWLEPLVVGSLFVTVGAVGLQAHLRRQPARAAVALVGGAAICCGRLWLDSLPLTLLGTALLLAAAVPTERLWRMSTR